MKRCVITSKMLNAIMLVLLLSVAGLTKLHASYSFSAVCETGQTLYYSITDAENHYVSVVYPGDYYNPWYGFTKPTGEMVIPEIVAYWGADWQVTSIEGDAFYWCYELTSVTLSNLVTNIGTDAFYGCTGLTSVTLGNSITNIGYSAFAGCTGLTSVFYTGDIHQWCQIQFAFVESNPICYSHNLYINNELVTDLMIPETVTEIKQYAFYNCTGLTSMTIVGDVMSIGEKAFANCSGLTTVTLGNSVTSIGEYAFFKCSGLTTLTIPDSVTSIGNHAFNSCSGLTSLTIGNSVTNIGDYAFSNCSGLTIMTLGNSVTSIGISAFESCSSLTGSLNIPNSVTNIENLSFAGCSSLKNLTIGNSVTKIGHNAFYGCNEMEIVFWNAVDVTDYPLYGFPFDNCPMLETVIFGDSVETIPMRAFESSHSLTSVTIGNSVTNIGDASFYYCSGLTTLNLGNSVTNIGNQAFEYCDGLTSVYFNGDIYQWCQIQFAEAMSNPICYAHNLYINNELVTDLVIPETVTEIKQYAFFNCSCLTSLTMEEAVTSIGEMAFCYCTGLSGSLNIPDSVTSVGDDAFNSCSGLTSLIIGNSVSNIGNSAFYYCTGLTGSLTIPNSVTSVGEYAFYSCSGLTSLTIGDSVTSIGNSAFLNCREIDTIYWNAINVTTYSSKDYHSFRDCQNLKTVIFGDSVESIPDYAFYRISGLIGSLTIPNSVTSIGGYAFYSCYGLTSLTIGSSVSNIGDYAFYNCNGLTSLTIPNSVTNIGEMAFGYCTGLTGSLILGNSVLSIGDYAFFDCYELESLTIPNSVMSIGVRAFNYCNGMDTVYWNAVDVTDYPLYGFPFDNCPMLETVIFGDSVETIPDNAFSYRNLTSLAIPASVTSIGDYAFSNCENIAYITALPEIPATIGDNTFYNVQNNIPVDVPCGSADEYRSSTGWSKFTNYPETNCPVNVDFSAVYETGQTLYYAIIDEDDHKVSVVFPGDATVGYWSGYTEPSGDLVIPESVIHDNIEWQVTKIWSNSFNGCSGLTSVTIPLSVTSIGGDAFSDCSGLYSVYWNAVDVTSYPSPNHHPFSNCSSLETVTFSDSVETIPSFALYGCNGLTSLTIPNSVTKIGNSAFVGCSRLTAVYWNAVDVTSYPSYKHHPFSNCPNLETVIFGDSVETIPSFALYGCNGLTSLTIGSSVYSIDMYAFRDCNGLTSLMMGVSVTNIGYGVFAGCDGLTLVYYSGDIQQWCQILFANQWSNPIANANYLYINDELVTDLVIPETVTEIKQYAFSGYSSLTSLTIGNSVMNIGKWAFRDCNNLTNMMILNEMPSTLGNNSFYNVATNIPVYIPCGSLDAYQAASGWSEFTNYFEMCYSGTINVTVDLEEGGVVTGDGYYEGGTVCTLTATANDGYSFLYWTDNGVIVSNDEVYSFIVGGDRNLVANFMYGDLCSITFNLYDSYGDGYTGNYLVVNLQDGICQKLTVASGSFASYTLHVWGHIALGWITGSWSSDCSFTVIYEDGTVIYEGSNLDSDFSYEFDVDCGDGYVQTINLVAGTNWFSANVEITLNDMKAALVAVSPNAAITIKSQTQKATYNPSNGRWTGRLTTFDLSQMYKITVSSACEITLEGVRINPAEHPITITPGANWIAYPLNTSKTPQEIFTGFAVPGDMVKSQSQKKQYNSNGRWTGQLGDLEPGKGYIYTSSATKDREFTFPTF